MNFNLIIPLVSATLCVFLIILVVAKGYSNPKHRVFSLYLLGLALWSIFAYAFRSSPDISHALFWNRFIPPAAILASVSFLHFTYTYTQKPVNKWLIYPGIIEFIVVSALSPTTDLFITEIATDAYGYYPIFTTLNSLANASAYVFFIVGLVNLVKKYRVSPSYEERNSYLYIIVGVACYLTGGFTDILSIFGVAIPPVALVGNILFAFLAGIALLRYNLLDMRLIIRKGTAYFISSLIIALPYVGLIVLFRELLEVSTVSNVVFFILLLLLAIVLRPVWSWAQTLVDRLFYRERYNYMQSLVHFSSQAQSVTDLKQFASTLVNLLGEYLQTSSAYLLIPESSSGDFIVTAEYHTGSASNHHDIRFPSYMPLIQYLSRHDEFVLREDLDVHPSLQAIPAIDKQYLDEMDAEISVPIKTREKDLVGILILGRKRSSQFYSIEEKRLITLIVDQVAMGLDNARLFQESRQAREELEKAQERLVQSERLKALGEMSSGIAHDFNNILTGILGRAQLAMVRIDEPKTKRDIELIEQGALDAAQMVRRLQDVARVRTDRSFEPVNLNEIMESALEMVRPRLNELLETRDAGIKIVMDRTQVDLVEGSPGELREVLVNLLINATEAMPNGGELTLRSRQEGSNVSVSIGDSGVGMTEEIQKNLFTPFFSTKGQKGLGMGLSVSYGIINRHEGTIDVESQPGKGTVFTITLPVTGRLPSQEADSEPNTENRGARLLVIDDDPNAREVIAEALSSAGYMIDTAVNGKQGLSLAGKNEYDLIIADLGMPDISGRQVARTISKNDPTIPIILITGWGIQLDQEELKADGIDGVIAKPVSIKNIISQVGDILSQNTDSSNIES